MISIYGRANCVWCTRAKNLLEARGLEYEYFSFPEDISPEEFQEKFPGRKTVPQIIVDGVLLDNGYTSLVDVVDNYGGGYGDNFA